VAGNESTESRGVLDTIYELTRAGMLEELEFTVSKDHLAHFIMQRRQLIGTLRRVERAALEGAIVFESVALHARIGGSGSNAAAYCRSNKGRSGAASRTQSII
jgi:hypothetical protein